MKEFKKIVKLIKVIGMTYKIKDNDGIYYEIKDIKSLQNIFFSIILLAFHYIRKKDAILQ